MADVAEAASWYFGCGLSEPPRARRAVAARKAACRELGFTWSEIGRAFDRDHSTVVMAFKNGTAPDPDDVAALIGNAKARALADEMVR